MFGMVVVGLEAGRVSPPLLSSPPSSASLPSFLSSIYVTNDWNINSVSMSDAYNGEEDRHMLARLLPHGSSDEDRSFLEVGDTDSTGS